MRYTRKGGLDILKRKVWKENEFFNPHEKLTTENQFKKKEAESLRAFVESLSFEELRDFLAILEMDDHVTEKTWFVTKKRVMTKKEMIETIIQIISNMPNGWCQMLYWVPNIASQALSGIKVIMKNFMSMLIAPKYGMVGKLYHSIKHFIILLWGISLIMSSPLIGTAITLRSHTSYSYKEKKIVEFIKTVLDGRMKLIKRESKKSFTAKRSF